LRTCANFFCFVGPLWALEAKNDIAADMSMLICSYEKQCLLGGDCILTEPGTAGTCCRKVVFLFDLVLCSKFVTSATLELLVF